MLAIDTTAVAASAAVTDGGRLVGEFFVNTKLTHSRTLMPMIDALLNNAELKPDDIDAVAVNVGPGSFTGVRIGVAAAKGLAFKDNLPCVPVSTLLSMAYSLAVCDCTVCAVMDARRNQVYNALFKVKGSEITRLCPDRALSLDELKAELADIKNRIIIIGDGTEITYNYVKDEIKNAEPAPESLRFQRASAVAAAAEKIFADGGAVSAEQLMPAYLRLPQAERELKMKKVPLSKGVGQPQG